MSAERPSGKKETARDRSVPRKLAEWFSFGISALLVLALAGYLIFRGLQPRGEHVPIVFEVLRAQAQAGASGTTVPVRIRNAGDRAVQDLRIELEAPSAGGAKTYEAVIDYLGEQSEQMLYFHLPEAPDWDRAKVQATSYQID